jgi:poly(3-hydroxybutyrate) depolymerase
MMVNNRGPLRVWRCSALARFTVYLALLMVGCSDNSKSSDGAGGRSGSAGASGFGGSASGSGGSSGGGVSGSGGSSSGGVSGSGGSSSGGVSGSGGSSSGGVSGSGGSAGSSSMGTGGSSGSTSGGSGGTAGSGGSAGTGGSGGGSGAVPSAGCGKTSTITFGAVPGAPPNGFGTGGYVTIQSGGQSRGFAMRLPDNYDRNRPYRLFFGFHWNGGTSKDVDSGGSNGYSMAHFGLQALSKNGAIFVAPQGLGGAWRNSGGEDLTFVDAMVKLIQDNYCVDTTQIFANGFSYGGGMSYAIACGRAKVFRGVAIYNGAVLSGCEGGSDPIAYWQMAGLTDNVCTVGAATPMRDRFVRNNGCTAQNPPQPPQPPPYLSSGGHVCTNYTGCSSGHPIRWCVHQSGHGNAIVDGTADLYNSCATPPKSCSTTCPCTWVPEDVWSFFTSL